MKKSFIAFLALALGVNSLWAGAALFRVLIDLPARHRIGPLAFAELSKATDLSSGLVFYPVAAIGSALLSCTIWLAATRSRAPRVVRIATAIAAISTLLVLALTTKAAPLMFRIGSAGGDVDLIDALADGFARWTNLRATAAGVAAVALLYALAFCAIQNSARNSPA